jgi:CBS domain-containing protein
MQNKTGDLPQKEIKMTRKESSAGRKQYRYVRDMPLVAEDIMSSPLITVKSDDLATYAAGIMVKERINGLPVIGNGIMGILTGDNIVNSILAL